MGKLATVAIANFDDKVVGSTIQARDDVILELFKHSKNWYTIVSSVSSFKQ